MADHATVSIEVKRYQQDIVSFLRVHRAVAGGVSAAASKHLDKLAKYLYPLTNYEINIDKSRCLAPLHNLTYATPSLIALAARKIYLHRIQIVRPENERSMQWGSDLDAISALLEGIGPEDVIEEVLGSAGAEAPL